jgi:hypothetical protein
MNEKALSRAHFTAANTEAREEGNVLQSPKPGRGKQDMPWLVSPAFLPKVKVFSGDKGASATMVATDPALPYAEELWVGAWSECCLF